MFKDGELIEFVERVIVVTLRGDTLTTEKCETSIVINTIVNTGSFQRYLVFFRGSMCLFNVWFDTEECTRLIGATSV